MSSVFDKIRENQDKKRQQEEESLSRINQDRVTKMLAQRNAKSEATQERLKEMIDRHDKQDAGSVFARIRRKEDEYRAMLNKQKEIAKENSQIDEYTRQGMAGEPISLVEDENRKKIDYNREAYINARMADSYVDRNNFSGTWGYEGKVFGNSDEDKWKDDLHYTYTNYSNELWMGGSKYNEYGKASLGDINTLKYAGKTPINFDDPSESSVPYDESFGGVAKGMWNQTMAKWKKDGVPNIETQMQSFKEIYGAEYDDRQANESEFERNMQNFVSGATLGYQNRFNSLLGEREGDNWLASVASQATGGFVGFFGPMKVSKLLVGGAIKKGIGTQVAKRTGAGQTTNLLKNTTKLGGAPKAQQIKEQLGNFASYLASGSDGSKLARHALESIVSFNLHTQAYKDMPGQGRNIIDRIKSIPHDTMMGGVFGSVGALGVFAKGTAKYRYAKAAELPVIGAFGVATTPTDPNSENPYIDKFANGLMFMAMHGMGMGLQAKRNSATLTKTKKQMARAIIDLDRAANEGKRTFTNSQVREMIKVATDKIKKTGTFNEGLKEYANIRNKIRQYNKWMDGQGANPKEKAARWRYIWEDFFGNMNKKSKKADASQPVGIERVIAEQKKGPQTTDPKTGKPLQNLENVSTDPIKSAEAKGVILDHLELQNIKKGISKLDVNDPKAVAKIQKNINEMRNTLGEGYVVNAKGELQPVVTEEAAELSAVLDAYEAKLFPQKEAKPVETKPTEIKANEPTSLNNEAQTPNVPNNLKPEQLVDIEQPKAIPIPLSKPGDTKAVPIPIESKPSVPLNMAGVPQIVETPIVSVKDKPKTAEYLDQLDKGGELFMQDQPYQDIRKIAKENNLEQYAADKSKGELQRVVELWRDENFTELKKLNQESKRFTEDDNYDLGEGPISPRTGKVLKQFSKPIDDIPSAIKRANAIDKWIDKAYDKMDEVPARRAEELQDQIYEAEEYRDNLYNKLEERGVSEQEINPVSYESPNQVSEAKPKLKVAAGGAGEPPKPPVDPAALEEYSTKLSKPTRPSAKGNELVVVDVAKANELFKKDEGYYLGDKGQYSPKEGIKESIENNNQMSAPIASIAIKNGKPFLSFTDGRHRFSQLRDAGAKNIALSMTPAAAKNARELGLDQSDFGIEGNKVPPRDAALDVLNWNKPVNEALLKKYGEGWYESPRFAEDLEAEFGVDTLQELTPEQVKQFKADRIVETTKAIDTGFEVSMNGLSPQNIKMAYDTLISTGQFLFKDLPEYTKIQAKRHGITPENFKNKFKEWSEDPNGIPQKTKSMLKKIWNVMKKWWKKGKKGVIDYLKNPKIGMSIQEVGKDGKPITPKQKLAQRKLVKGAVKGATEVPKKQLTRIVNKISSKNIIELKEPTPQFGNVSDLSKYLNKRALKIQKEEGINLREDTPQANEIVAQALASEIRAENEREWNADGWYSDKMQGSLKIAEELYPAMKDPIKKTAFNFGLAITSNGQGVPTNSRIAMEQYEYYLENGRWNEDFGKGLTKAEKEAMGAGKEMPAMRKAFKLYNDLMDTWGEDTLQRFLNTDFTVRELSNAGIKNIGGENMDTIVKGSAIFGPKVGGAFFQNVQGNFDPLTMDLHYTRNIRRITGDLLPEAGRGKEFGRDYTKQITNFKAVIRNNKSAREKYGITTEVLKDDAAMIDIAKKIHRAFAQGKYKKKTLLNKRAKNLDEIVNQPKENPRGGNERNRFRKIQKRVVEITDEKTIADSQAKLWFPQKRLYGKFGIKGESVNETDYLQEFIKIAKERGFDDKRISGILGKKQFGIAKKSGISPDAIKENRPFQKLTEAEKAAILDGTLKYSRTESELDSIMREVNSTFGAGPFTPANMKLLRYGLVKAGKFVFKDLPKHMQRAGKKLGINELNFSQAMNMLKDAPKSISNWFKKVYKHMKHWWNNGSFKKELAYDKQYKDVRRSAERRGTPLSKEDLKTFTLKRNAIAHALEDSLLKSGKVSKQTLARDKFIATGSKSLADIMKRDKTGNILDEEADLKINSYIKILRRYEDTDRMIRGGRLVMKSMQAPRVNTKNVMDLERDRRGGDRGNPYARIELDHREFVLDDPDLIAEQNKPSLYDTYDASKLSKNLILGGVRNTRGWMDVCQQSTGLPVYDYFEKIQHNAMVYEDNTRIQLNPIYKYIEENYGVPINELDKTEMRMIQSVGQGLRSRNDLSEKGRGLLDVLKSVLNDKDFVMEGKLVRYNQWAEKGVKPKGVDINDLELLKTTLDEQGYGAFRELLDKTEGFTIPDNYMPNLSENRVLENGNMPDNMRIHAGTGVSKSREDVGAKEGNAVTQVIRKVKAQNKLYYLDPSIEPMRAIIKNADMDRVITDNLTNYIKEVYYKPEGGAVQGILDKMFGQLMSGAMTDPSKILRNLLQPLTLPFSYLKSKAILPFMKEYLRMSFGKGSLRIDRSKDLAKLPKNVIRHFWTNVSQDRAWSEEMMNQGFGKFLVKKLGNWGKRLQTGIDQYKWSDTANRFKIYHFIYKQVSKDLETAFRTGLRWEQKSKAYKGGKNLRESLLWDIVGHHKSLQDSLYPHIQKAMRGSVAHQKYVAMKIAQHISGPTINWEYHRTLRMMIEKNNPSLRTLLRAFTYPWSVYNVILKDANIMRKGMAQKNMPLFMNGLRATTGRIVSYSIIESVILNGLQGFKDEENKYHWGYRMPDMFLYMPGSIAESQLKFMANTVKTIGAFFTEDSTAKAISGFGNHAEGTMRVYLPYYKMITRAWAFVFGQDRAKPVYEFLDNTFGVNEWNPDPANRNIWQMIQNLFFGGGYKDVDRFD